MKTGKILLISAAFFWGISGLVTQVALNYNSTMMIIMMRFAVASLISFIVFKPKIDMKHLKLGFLLSCLLMGIYYTSTEGLKYTSASNASFIIGSNVVVVPLINRLLYKKPLYLETVLSSLVCLFGLGLITLTGATSLNVGDIFCMIDMVIYSFYIVLISNEASQMNTEKLVTVQYMFVSFMAAIYLIMFEKIQFEYTLINVASVGVLGFFCTFLAFYFQNKGQKEISPENASQLLALMPIFATLLDLLFADIMISQYTFLGMLIILYINISFKSTLSKFIGKMISNREVKYKL